MSEPTWRKEGTEPDYRFSLANERTFLAWIRTALALLGGGVMLEQFAHGMRSPRLAAALSACLCLAAAALCLVAYRRWRANEIAMRHQSALPWSPVLLLLCALMVILGVAVVGAVLASTFNLL
jgi:putative membrane protein